MTYGYAKYNGNLREKPEKAQVTRKRVDTLDPLCYNGTVIIVTNS